MRSALARVGRFAHRWFWKKELIPDPYGIVGFALGAGVLLSYLTLVPSEAYLWSESLLYEILGHAWLLLAPPLSLFLGMRQLLVCRDDSPLAFLSVPLALILTLTTTLGVTVALVLG